MEKLAKTYIRQLGEYDTSCNYLLFLVLFWEIVGFLLRLWFFAEMSNGLVLPGKIRTTKRELVSAMAKACTEIMEEDAFAKLRMQDFENMTNDYLHKINLHIYSG